MLDYTIEIRISSVRNL